MSRERFIDPDTWTSKDICSVSLMADLLFIACISTADDHGRRGASPHCLKASIFPTRNEVTEEMVESWRNELAQRGMIRLYRNHNGTEYLDIPAWSRHQHPRYVAKSKIPQYPGGGAIVVGSVQNSQDRPQSVPIGENLVAYVKSEQLSHKPPESAEGRGGVCSEGSDIHSPVLGSDISVVNKGLTATPRPGMAHGAPQNAETSDETATKRQTAESPLETATQEPMGSLLDMWLASEPKYRRPGQLKQMVNLVAGREPVLLLAHMREIEAMEDPLSRCALLWKRLVPEKAKKIMPGEEAMKTAKRELLADPDGDGAGARGGPISSPADALQDLLAGKEKSGPPEPDPKSLEVFDGLTEGWSGPNDHNHDGEKAIARTMLATNPQKVIAYAYQINGEEIIKGAEPWGRIAEMCGSLEAPMKSYGAKAMQRLSRHTKAPV